ncbi:MAG: VTT domain-containing protein [Caldilineales bacterium]|nr:VTT domain-containing protein [Caldilineales bacterium]MDW8318817.1 VTT domain-containing protein [Anaerolineae bacterium]
MTSLPTDPRRADLPAADVQPVSSPRIGWLNHRAVLRWALLAAAALALAWVVFKYRQPLLALATDQATLQAWVERLGPWGPLGLVAISALQVVFAFVPGPVIQVVGGYLFGWFGGAVFGVIGMVLGGAIAMTLSRLFGRPLVQRMIGAERLARWERVARLNSLPIWFVLMLGPFGDVPYYIAGLTSLPVWKIVAVAAFVRGPSVIVAAAIGAGVIPRNSPVIVVLLALAVAIMLLAVRYQRQIEAWVDRHLLQRVVPGDPPAAGHALDPAPAADSPEAARDL